MHDLAIIITSLNDGSWLDRCLTTVRDASANVDVDVVVVDIESTDDTVRTCREHGVRVVRTSNGGYAHANNVGLLTCDARYVLFLNPDTEVVDGSFAGLVRELDRRGEVGIVGCRQLTGAGDLYPTMRRFQRPRRILAEALFCERWGPRLGHRVLDMGLYERDVACDWTIGSFLLARREALASAGTMDERFFFTSEEEDLCLRVRRAGWDVRHVPTMTIVHHVGKRGVRPQFEAQRAFARRQYAEKNFSPAGRLAHRAAEALYDAIRAALPERVAPGRRAAAVRALRTTLGLEAAPFRPPPVTALPPHAAAESRADHDADHVGLP